MEWLRFFKLIINNKIVRGPIECHICTSDWYRHKHHQNSVYGPVILHVVRKLNGGIIPQNQLRLFSILQGLIAIDNKWRNKRLCHLCPLKKNNYVDSK